MENNEKLISETKRVVATKKAISEYCEKNPQMTDELICDLVKSIYPDFYVDNLEVANEVKKELVRRSEPYSDEVFVSILKELTESRKLLRYSIEMQNQSMLINSRLNLLDYILKEAKTHTLFLSECEEYKLPILKQYFEEKCEQKGKTLAQVFQEELYYRNVYQELSFHCYGEPNGDVVFTKNKRNLSCWDKNGKPLHSETELISDKSKSGCLSIILILIVVCCFALI